MNLDLKTIYSLIQKRILAQLFVPQTNNDTDFCMVHKYNQEEEKSSSISWIVEQLLGKSKQKQVEE